MARCLERLCVGERGHDSPHVYALTQEEQRDLAAHLAGMALMEGLRELDWRERAACAAPSADPDWFFPEPTSADKQYLRRGALTLAERRAKYFCLLCPVRRECLEYSLKMEGDLVMRGAVEGVWGGTLPRERREARKLPPEARADALELMVLDQAVSKGLAREEEVRV